MNPDGFSPTISPAWRTSGTFLHWIWFASSCGLSRCPGCARSATPRLGLVGRSIFQSPSIWATVAVISYNYFIYERYTARVLPLELLRHLVRRERARSPPQARQIVPNPAIASRPKGLSPGRDGIRSSRHSPRPRARRGEAARPGWQPRLRLFRRSSRNRRGRAGRPRW